LNSGIDFPYCFKRHNKPRRGSVVHRSPPQPVPPPRHFFCAAPHGAPGLATEAQRMRRGDSARPDGGTPAEDAKTSLRCPRPGS
jgi:hypothetical protein